MVDRIRIPESAELLNHACACRFTDAAKLDALLGAGADRAFVEAIHASRPHLFAAHPVFITEAERKAMAAVVGAVERVVALPAYQRRALEGENVLAHVDHGERGVLFGFDFHLSVSGPKLIEINTNAGGSLLALALSRAQVACCSAVDSAFALGADLPNVEDSIFAMFASEHARVFGDTPLERIAIIDEAPEAQFLKPEFELFAQLFARHGIDARVLSPSDVVLSNGRLRARSDDSPIDLVYNRLTDFALVDEALAPIAQAFEARVIALTPNPRAHALFADKARLVTLSDSRALAEIGASREDIELLCSAVPETRLVTTERADAWWHDRKGWFFKPRDGFGSRAAYRGDKLTRRVWETIAQTNETYVAQRIVPPRERLVHFAHEDESEGEHVLLKYDVRNYAFEGNVLLLAARLYQGQTTNFRTERGGFAAVYAERP